MNNIKIFATLLFLVISFVVSAAVIPVDAAISQVIVYRQGATVQRTIPSNYELGEQSILLRGISRFIKNNSLRAMLPDHIQLLDVSVRNQYEWEREQRSDELIQWEDRIAEIGSEKSILLEEKSLLQQNKVIKGNENLSAEELSSFLDFYTDRLKKNSKATVLLDRELKVLRQQVKRYKIEHKVISKDQKIIELKIYVHEQKRSDIFIQYLINNASWTTTYDVKMNRLDDPLQLDYKGRVINNSGVDWKDVDLRLSTGNPNMSITRPPLSPWVLIEHQVYSKRKLSNSYDMSKETIAANMREEMGNKMADDIGQVESRENVTAMEFKLTEAHDILADGQFHEVLLKSHEMPANYAYEVVPKVSSYAYLMANIPNWYKYQLSQGNMRVFIENAYQGEVYFNPAQHKDTLQISLGVDIGVHVKREQVDGLVGSSWFGSKKEKNITWKITVSNHKSAPIDISIFDQIPISRDDDISVDLEDFKGGKLNKETGEIKWQERIGKGGQVERRFSYKIKYPKSYYLGSL